jgi:lipid A 3-O-deacylase
MVMGVVFMLNIDRKCATGRDKIGFMLVAIVVAFTTTTPALADISEVRFGVFAHNIETNVSKNAGKEGGQDIELEILFDSPALLKRIGAPRPSLVASLNTQGETSFAGVSLDWRFPVSERFSIDPFLGYVIHSGDPLNNPFPPSDSVRRAAFNAEELALGSRDVFRLGFALGYRHSETWTSAIVYEHLSHGHILGGNKNQGLDNIGVRLGRAF